MLFCVSFFSISHPQMERNPVRVFVLVVLFKLVWLGVGVTYR